MHRMHGGRQELVSLHYRVYGRRVAVMFTLVYYAESTTFLVLVLRE